VPSLPWLVELCADVTASRWLGAIVGPAAGWRVLGQAGPRSTGPVVAGSGTAQVNSPSGAMGWKTTPFECMTLLLALASGPLPTFEEFCPIDRLFFQPHPAFEVSVVIEVMACG